MGLLNREHTMASTLLDFLRGSVPERHSAEYVGRGPDRTIEAGDFNIDTRRRTVTIREHEISLTEAELDLLLFLCRHRRKVVTPRTLLITRWSERETHQQDFLPVLLSLRKKLDCEIPGQHYIRMEPWVLCRFEPNTI